MRLELLLLNMPEYAQINRVLNMLGFSDIVNSLRSQ